MKRRIAFMVMLLFLLMVATEVFAAEYPYCKYGNNPLNENRQLASEEFLYVMPVDFEKPVVTRGRNSWSKPCLIRKGDTVVIREETVSGEKRFYLAWVKSCGNDIHKPNKIDRYFWWQRPGGATVGDEVLTAPRHEPLPPIPNELLSFAFERIKVLEGRVDKAEARLDSVEARLASIEARLLEDERWIRMVYDYYLAIRKCAGEPEGGFSGFLKKVTRAVVRFAGVVAGFFGAAPALAAGIGFGGSVAADLMQTGNPECISIEAAFQQALNGYAVAKIKQIEKIAKQPGPQGPQGPQGPGGPQGPQGPPGQAPPIQQPVPPPVFQPTVPPPVTLPPPVVQPGVPLPLQPIFNN